MRWFTVLTCSAIFASVACGEGDNDQTPDTVLESQPPALTNVARAEFSFRAVGVSNSFTCIVDQGSPSTCVPPVMLDLPDGEHTFSVAAGLNGANDETPAMHTWRIDTAAPDTALLLGPPPVDNDTTPEITFEGSDAEGPVTFVCTLDAGSPAACTSPFAATVVDGNHTFSVAALDAAGNLDASPVVLDWRVDTTLPDTVIDSGPTEGSTTASSVTFTFSSPDAGATFECATDGAAFATCVSPVTLNTLADGAHDFAVRAVGVVVTNIDPSPATRAWIVDAIAPSVEITGTPTDPSNDLTPQFTFSSSDATATFECQLDGVAAFAACTSPFESPALTDGSRTFRVRATDAVGNAGGEATFAWVLDTLAPTVTITTQPTALSSDTTPSVAFTTAGAPVTTECRVDAGAPVACASPFTFPATPDGAHTITVTVTDAAGNTGSDTATFTIDTVVPTVTITAEPLAASSDNTPSVAFVVTDAPSVIQCRRDAGTFVACTSPFTFGITPDGNHTITVRVADGAGNASTATTTQFAIDTIAPTVAINTEPPTLGNDPTPTITFTVSGSPTTTQCQVDAGALVDCAGSFTPTVTDGAHTITVRVADAAGNTGSDTTASFTVDTVAPTVVINTEPATLSNDSTPTVTFTTGGAPSLTQCQVDAGTLVNCAGSFTQAVADGAHTITVRVSDDAGNTASDTTASFTVDTAAPTVTINTEPAVLSNDATPTVAFTVTGGPTTIECQVDAGAFAACTSPFTTTVADGAHTITVRVADGAGNTASDTTASFTVDTVAPTVVINTEPAALSNDGSPTVTFTTGGAPTTTQCQLDGGALASCTSPFTTPAADGAHTITIRVADGAGNVATATTNSFTIDTVPPTVAITTEPAVLSSDDTPTVTFTVGGSPTSTQCQVDTGGFLACTSPFTTTVADGTHRITVRVTDGAGNSATDTTRNFNVDTVAPTVTINSQPAALSNDGTPTVTFTVAGAPTTIQCQVDNGALASCTSPFTTSVADGAHTITVRVADGAGNASTASTNPFTVDTVAPTVVINTEPAALGNDSTPTITFTVTGSPTSTQCQVDTGALAACTSPFTTGVLADGAHTITVRVTDGAGNTGTDTTASFTIDTVVTVAINTEPAANSNDSTPTITFTTGGAPTSTQCQLDNGALVACAGSFTATAADGAHTMTVRVADGAGNLASDTTATFNIDTVVPSVTIVTEPPALTNDNTPSVTFTVTDSPTIIQCRVDAGAFGACTSPFTAAPIPDGGPHTITVRVADAVGNAGTATTSPFTIDTVAPGVAIVDAPPARWPVNYFDVLFSSADTTATFQCTLNGVAVTPCASPLALQNLPYDLLQTFRVTASDAAGNSSTTQTTWTSSAGLVLDYGFEQGSTANASLLRQNPVYSPDGPQVPDFLGGWAGTALGSTAPRVVVPGTARALSSSANDQYTASFWIRPSAAALGTVFSTLGVSGGLEARIEGSTLTVTVRDNGTDIPRSTVIPTNQWTSVGLRAPGPAKGLDVFINGDFAIHVPAPIANGFGALQAKDLGIGSFAGFDLDDLRFYNVAFVDLDMCTLVARGSFEPSLGRCTPLSPGFELDFEGKRVADTGIWKLQLTPPTVASFQRFKTGDALRLTEVSNWSYSGFAAQAPIAPGHSFSMWFLADPAQPGTLLDFTTPCGTTTCGMKIAFESAGNLSVFIGTDLGFQQTAVVPVPVGVMNNVVITERRDGNTTQAISIYINGKQPLVVPVPSGDVFAIVNTRIQMPALAVIDEYEFWTEDLSSDPEMLCENGFDGEFDHVDLSCALTSN